jgi:two-component system cell cycle sensor histidine kinase/response regulator CckA
MRTIILIVDDEDIVRRLIRLALREFDDIDCIEATDAEEALEISKRYRGPIDLLLSDVMMPGGMNGDEMAMKLSDARPETRVLLMSGHSVQAIKMKPHWRFIEKPFGASDIRDAVRSVLMESVEHALRRAG